MTKNPTGAEHPHPRGTSAVGLTAVPIAHQLGATVIGTTRNPASTVGTLNPTGLDAALELVSATALPATLSLVRPGGTVCFVGALTGHWTISDFSPFSIPTGDRLTNYAATARDLAATALDQHLRAIGAKHFTSPSPAPTKDSTVSQQPITNARLVANPEHTSSSSLDPYRRDNSDLQLDALVAVAREAQLSRRSRAAWVCVPGSTA